MTKNQNLTKQDTEKKVSAGVYAAYALGFIVEIVAWVGFAAVAFWISSGIIAWILAIILFALVVGFWSVWMAPKAPRKFGAPMYYVCKILIYAVAAVVLWRWNNAWAIAFVVATLLSEPFLYQHNLEQPGNK